MKQIDTCVKTTVVAMQKNAPLYEGAKFTIKALLWIVLSLNWCNASADGTIVSTMLTRCWQWRISGHRCLRLK
ncbi:hypothetical protein [Janthinobacterium sp. PC23-8]|uniref:hypothetical protein n=1 Tax=Janthinobacterium sp. PC23-8 TaxID=2012679 RepID=UPI00113FCC0B|nr:hypothetical protein [Janthinobacterium sp. PC23-8]